MSTKSVNANDANVVVENVEANENVKNFTAKVLRVRSADKFGNRRITVQTDTSFESYDEKGNVINTDSFTIDSGQIWHAECNEPLHAVINYKALDRAVKKSVCAAILTGAMIEFTRELKTPEDVRQNGEHYTSVQWTTKLNKITCNIPDAIKPFLVADIQGDLFEKEVRPNPANIFAQASASIML